MNSKRVTIEKVKTKQILNKPAEKIDTWFWVKRGLNPYRGCEHNCRYCDVKAEYYRINNFGTHIRVKINAPSVLEKELRKEDYLPIKRKGEQTLWQYISLSKYLLLIANSIVQDFNKGKMKSFAQKK
ncbi:MAG: hypothetical protein ACFFCQ_04705 [Promethearchaeota archaeon]